MHQQRNRASATSGFTNRKLAHRQPCIYLLSVIVRHQRSHGRKPVVPHRHLSHSNSQLASCVGWFLQQHGQTARRMWFRCIPSVVLGCLALSLHELPTPYKTWLHSLRFPLTSASLSFPSQKGFTISSSIVRRGTGCHTILDEAKARLVDDATRGSESTFNAELHMLLPWSLQLSLQSPTQ